MSEEKEEQEELAYALHKDDYSLKCFYVGTNKNARVELLKNGNVVRNFSFPAYKIYNLGAHFDEIIESENNGNIAGYKIAASCF